MTMQQIHQYLKGIFGLSWKIFAILFLIFLFLELVKRLGGLMKGAQRSARWLGIFGFNEAAIAPLLTGIFFGILYGAGVIADLIKKQNVESKQVFLVSMFLSLCHAIFEDTGLFLVLGANIFWLTIPRLILAFGVTLLANKIFPQSNT